jgi:predicted  nucleic acid-binding Zn-ribbon protein
MSDVPDNDPTGVGALLLVQDEDLRIDQLEHKRRTLPELAEIRAIDDETKRIDARVATTTAERAVLNDRLSALESETEEIASRVAAIEARLSGSDAANYRDQESMALEIDQLALRQRGYEDEELEVMEALEPLENSLAELATSRAALAEHRVELEARVRETGKTIEDEIAVIRARRNELAEAVPPALMVDYEKLRAHLGGIGAARIVRGACSGCNLALSATELDRIRHSPGTIFHCEQCGRLLGH